MGGKDVLLPNPVVGDQADAERVADGREREIGCNRG